MIRRVINESQGRRDVVGLFRIRCFYLLTTGEQLFNIVRNGEKGTGKLFDGIPSTILTQKSTMRPSITIPPNRQFLIEP